MLETSVGFRKVDPDRWEFANEGFLGGQKHLLKTIKRRRNVTQSIQQEGAACVEIGQYGLDGEIEILRRDRNLLVTQIVKLRQQQQLSREQLLTMEARIQSAERKQQHMMTFLAKALTNPSFVQNLMHKNEQNKAFEGIEIGRKRRLTASLSTENFQERVLPATVEATQIGDYPTHARGGFANVESEIETLFSAALDDESSSDVIEPKMGPDLMPFSSSVELGCVGEINWEKLLSEDLIGDDKEEVDVPIEDLVPESSNWGEDLQDLIDQMGVLISKP